MGIIDLGLEHIGISLKRFEDGRLMLLGVVELLVTISLRSFMKTIMLNFLVAEEDSPD